MLSTEEILDHVIWMEFGKESLVREIAQQLNLTERTIHRKLERWQKEKKVSFEEGDLAKIKTIVEEKLDAHLRHLKQQVKGIVLITDDVNCPPVKEYKQKAFKNHWAQMAPGQSSFSFSPFLLKMDISIIVVFQDRQLTEILEKTDKTLFDKATHQSTLPPLKRGDCVMLVTKSWRAEKLSDELILEVE